MRLDLLHADTPHPAAVASYARPTGSTLGCFGSARNALSWPIPLPYPCFCNSRARPVARVERGRAASTRARIYSWYESSLVGRSTGGPSPLPSPVTRIVEPCWATALFAAINRISIPRQANKRTSTACSWFNIGDQKTAIVTQVGQIYFGAVGQYHIGSDTHELERSIGTQQCGSKAPGGSFFIAHGPP